MKMNCIMKSSCTTKDMWHIEKEAKDLTTPRLRFAKSIYTVTKITLYHVA